MSFSDGNNCMQDCPIGPPCQYTIRVEKSLKGDYKVCECSPIQLWRVCSHDVNLHTKYCQWLLQPRNWNWSTHTLYRCWPTCLGIPLLAKINDNFKFNKCKIARCVVSGVSWHPEWAWKESKGFQFCASWFKTSQASLQFCFKAKPLNNSPWGQVPFVIASPEVPLYFGELKRGYILPKYEFLARGLFILR